jgi:CMP-N-acetylneuraminic acid synthetase
MYKGKTFTAIIPARGGSKGIPGKNIKDMAGKPLIAYALQAATDSGIFDHIYVSTEDERIAAVVRCLGYDVLHRPKELAKDDTPTLPVITYHCKHDVDPVDYVFILEATNPLMSLRDVQVAAEYLVMGKAFVQTVVLSDITFAAPLGLGGSLRGWYPIALRSRRRQECPQSYRIGGGIYAAKWYVFATGLEWYSAEIASAGLPIAPEHCDDIDTYEDWMRVEKKINLVNWKKNHLFLTSLYKFVIISRRVMRRILRGR